MSNNNLQRKIMLWNNITIKDLLTLRPYKKNPKVLYKQLKELREKGTTPTSERRTRELLNEFMVERSPEEYPEIWV